MERIIALPAAALYSSAKPPSTTKFVESRTE